MYSLWLIIREHDSVYIDSSLRMAKLNRNEKIILYACFRHLFGSQGLEND